MEKKGAKKAPSDIGVKAHFTKRLVTGHVALNQRFLQ